MKKICIAIHALSQGGAERVAVSWANSLIQHGHDVFMLIYGKCDNAYALDERVRVIFVAETPEAFFEMPVWKRLWSIRKIIRHEAPQTLINFLPKLQINMMLATLGMKLERIETIRNNPWMDKDVGRKRFLWNLCFHRADKIILQTPEQGEYFGFRLRKKCTVINNPIDQEFSKGKKEYSGKIRRFVAVGRMSAQKNYEMMIRAFTLAVSAESESTLDIYGAGTLEVLESTMTLIRELRMEGRICLKGWIRNIADVLPQYDAFLMSSNYEGMPNALAEAMAAGLVCLSTNCKTGPKDMIEHGKTGYLAPVGDVNVYAQEICSMLEMTPNQCVEMGSTAQKKIFDMCSEENTLLRLNNLIEKKV